MLKQHCVYKGMDLGVNGVNHVSTNDKKLHLKVQMLQKTRTVTFVNTPTTSLWRFSFELLWTLNVSVHQHVTRVCEVFALWGQTLHISVDLHPSTTFFY